MFYLIYKITNNINNKIYIGSHKTKNINDRYMGSGKYLNYAFNKYGVDNFSKEILFVYDNPTAMYAKEAEIVNDEFLAEENTYNLKRGGMGGFDFINSKNLNRSAQFNKLNAKNFSILGHAKLKEIRANNPEWQEERNKVTSLVTTGHPGYFSGKRHTTESKKKMSIYLKENQIRAGEKNSQYGTCWITDGTNNKKIKISELDTYLNLGYYKGRKLPKK